MDSISRRHKLQKVGKAVKTSKSIDRISSLPDSVLCHMLSFLPTKYAVGTSILSTRWRYLFASIPSLDFDASLRSRWANEIQARLLASTFMNFVDRVFILRNISYVDRFRLKCDKHIDASRFNAWICAALWHNIRELDLCISMKEFTMLPRDLFTCGTLVVLKLGAKFVLNVPIKVCLPNLKILHLAEIEFMNDDSIQRLISSCPVLEDLVILRCGWNNIRIFNISSLALKSLTINGLVRNEYITEFCKYEIVLNAPNLVYLKYTDFVQEGFSVKNLQSPAEAHIDVKFSSQQLEDGIHDYDEFMTEILRGISKVKFLHLSGDFMEAIGLSKCRFVLPTFFNVTRLVLCVHKKVGWRMLLNLLRRLPLLETLVFYHEGHLHSRYRNNFQWDPPLVPCFFSHLKTIEIRAFGGYKDELKMVEYFLKNARVLEKMKIRAFWKTKMKLISEKLLKLPRASKACQVAFSNVLN